MPVRTRPTVLFDRLHAGEPRQPVTAAGLFCAGCGLMMALLFGAPTAARAQADSVRVWVLAASPPEQVSIQSSTDELHITLRGEVQKRISIEDGRAVTVASDGSLAVITGPGTRSSVSSAAFTAADDGHFVLETSNLTRRYRGRFIISTVPDGSGLRVINEVAMDDYLASVVPSEYPFDELEGAKAQAVVARTYAIRARQSSSSPYDVTDDTGSQTYRGLDRETRVSRRAVSETRGQILTYRDRPIEAVYSASGGGHTADNEDVWNADPVPYLRGKPDPYDRESPHQEWRFAISKSALHELLSKEYGIAVRGIVFNDRSEEGRYRSVTLTGGEEREITASSFRYVVSKTFGARSLKSTLFRVHETNDQYVFEGRGFGHGVGLSQWGTHARAEAGQSYEEILRFYYTSVALETVEGEQIAAAQPAPTVSGEETGESAVDDRTGTTSAAAGSRLHGGWAARKPLSPEQIEHRPRRPGW